MSKTLDQFFPWVLPSAPGCSDLLAQQAIRSACVDFCNRTDLVQRVMAADATINVQDYVVSPPADMILSRVLSVSYQGCVLTVVPADAVNSDIVLRGATIGTAVPLKGAPSWYFQKTPTDSGFSVYPIPAVTLVGGLTVKASFSPSNAAATVEDVLFDDYASDIAAGALAALMLMPGQTFSSQKGQGYAVMFERAVQRGRHQKLTGAVTSGLRVMPVRFA